MTIRHRTYSDLVSADASGIVEQVSAHAHRVAERLEDVTWTVAVASGKGGVGKSLVSAGLAAAFADLGWKVGLLDADLNGPSAARMSGLGVDPDSVRVAVGEQGATPPLSPLGVRVMSMELLLEPGAPLAWREPASDSFVWRGAQERGALREFLSDIAWGRLDLLLVDLPPGTQRLVDLYELVPQLAGAIGVTIPTAASAASVRRSLTLARKRGIQLLGVLENMSGYACGGCGEVRGLFPGDAGERLSEEFGAPVLGRLPFDREAAECAEAGSLGRLLGDTTTGQLLMDVARRIRRILQAQAGGTAQAAGPAQADTPQGAP